MHWVAWDKVLASKEDGGLGIGSLRALNLALLAKWRWRLKLQRKDLWCKVIRSIHKLDRKASTVLSLKSISGVWNNIAKAVMEIQSTGMNPNSIFSNIVGDGRELQFWKDSWCRDCPLQQQYPDLYALERRKLCVIADRVGSNSPSFHWIRPPTSDVEMQQLKNLEEDLCDITLEDSEDKISYSIASDGIYTVASLREAIDKKILTGSTNIMEWTHLVPKKVQCFFWRARMNRIPTKVCLRQRNIPIQSPLCVFCNDIDETSDHLLVSCPFAKKCWEETFRWCKIPWPNFHTVNDASSFAATFGNCPKERTIALALCYGLTWLLWKARNNIIFNNKPPSSSLIVDQLISMTYIWVKHRGNYEFVSWLNWCNSPFKHN